MIAWLFHLRNWAYDRGFLPQVKLKVPVISIGNLTFGGTGKTPHVLGLAEVLKAKEHRVGIVLRSYGGSLSAPAEVSSDGAPLAFGDEAVLLRQRLDSDFVVWSGPSKSMTASALLKAHPQITILIVDDGFQHRRLKRDLDIVLLDTSVAKKEYRLPFWGRLREPMTGLKRAQVVCLTKMDQVNANTLDYLKQFLSSHPKILVLESRQEIGRPIVVQQAKTANGVPTSFGVFCGLGNPENFFSSSREAAKKYGFSVAGFEKFPDHAKYKGAEAQRLVQMAKVHSALLTSEKDAVKLRHLTESLNLYMLPMQVVLQPEWTSILIAIFSTRGPNCEVDIKGKSSVHP